VATSHALNKKLVLLALALAVTLAISGVVVAGCGVSNEQQGVDLQNGSGSLINVINVSGTGKVSTLPDKATIQVSVQSDGATSAAALDANSKDMKKVLDRLKAEGIADTAIETASVVVYPNRYYDQATGQEKTTGYRAENTITVTFTDFKRIGDIYAAVTEAGADNIYGPNWELSENNPATATALTRAIANAKSKAEAIAADQGVQLGDAIIISESSASQPYPIYSDSAAGAKSSDGSVTPPTIVPINMDVTASVTVTYRMTP
jgi:uncharacterized protein YggE